MDLPSENTQRRDSYRRSLNESGLSAEYLEQLEAKRKALDDSIHRFIASKEREYKAYEKELRQQSKRTIGHESQVAPISVAGLTATSSSAIDALVQTGASKKLHDSTSQIDFAGLNGTAKAQHTNEDLTGVFTPGYLAALEHPTPERTASAPPSGNVLGGSPNGSRVMRTNSDSAAQIQLRPSRLQLNQRHSSSGSSVDGRLISALKSSSEVSRPKHKRVSLAVGDSIVKPSDSVPVALSMNSTSSHSRSRALSKQSLLDVSQSALVLDNDSPTSPTNNTGPSPTIQTLQEQGSVSAAVAIERGRNNTSVPQEDVGDMFDLEEDEINASYEDGLPESSPEDYFHDHDDSSTTAVPGKSQSNVDEDTGQHSPDLVQSEPLVFAEGAAMNLPTSPGFRKPSASVDPMYVGRNYAQEEAEDEAQDGSFYGSSYNRSGKGSFTSSSLGESYMARNAELMMERRAQHQQQSRQPAHVMSVR